MRDMEIKNVKNITGGMSEWEKITKNSYLIKLIFKIQEKSKTTH
jgi:hypothetical protein